MPLQRWPLLQEDRLSDFLRLFGRSVDLLANDPVGYVEAVSRQRVTDLQELRPKHPIDDTGRRVNHDCLTVHREQSKGLSPYRRHRAVKNCRDHGSGIENLDSSDLALACSVNWRRTRSASAPAAAFSPAVPPPANSASILLSFSRKRFLASIFPTPLNSR